MRPAPRQPHGILLQALHEEAAVRRKRDRWGAWLLVNDAVLALGVAPRRVLASLYLYGASRRSCIVAWETAVIAYDSGWGGV